MTDVPKSPNEPTRCGYIAVVGRPNVGKSTLMNAILGEKVSITSRKPQTTRHQIVGIHTEANTQMVFLDTPGLHASEGQGALNRYMNRAARSALDGIDLIVWVVEPLRFTEEDDFVLGLIKRCEVPVWLVINKVDKIPDKDRLLPFISAMQERHPCQEVIPLSAQKGDNVAAFVRKLQHAMPESLWSYGAEERTNQHLQQRITEIIREKLMRVLGDELPYETTVVLEHWEQHEGRKDIYAIVWVAKDAQKPIVIGQGGARLKNISQQARIDLERLTGEKIFLRIWVKVKTSWHTDERALPGLGYHDPGG